MAVAQTIRIDGRVQGVGFRWAAFSEAQRIGVSGWVRNLPDGAVQTFVQGERDRVEALVNWLRSGPPGADVECVMIEEAPIDPDADGFAIR
jgi:acylphosphatase